MREMKDSGIEWIGDIPNTWKISRLKYYVFSINSGERLEGNYNDGDYPILGGGDVIGFCNVYNANEKAILIGRVGARCGCVTLPLQKVWATDNALVLLVDDKICNQFAYYLLCSVDLNKLNEANAQPLITTTRIRNVNIPIPTLIEQNAIADYLNCKCAEIDALTTDIESQIKTLEHYKRSIITEAVTKGLNPDVEMKDSGIKWVGSVPKSWDVKPIRAVFEEVTKKNKQGLIKTALKFTYGTIVRKTDFDADEDSYVADTILNYTIVEPGTIMLNGLNLNYDFISQRIGLVTEAGVITSAYMALKVKDDSYIKPEYATYLFKSYDGCKAFHNMGGGVRKILNFQEFQRYYVLIPPVQEQNTIITYLDAKCAEIDSIIADKQTQLETLTEYKKSLIYEYVTGKKEVPTA